VEVLSSHLCFGGTQHFVRHDSRECRGPMRVAVYEPPQASDRAVPVLYCLAGLTCTEETFAIKAGAQRHAAEHGIMLVMPDTSPREPRIPGDGASWDFGIGAGFYVDATVAPWSAHYRMYSYVTRELPEFVAAQFRSADRDRQSIMGHSMGGHGALVCGFREAQRYRSVSAFAPIGSPSQVPWGQKAFTGYLGEDRDAWLQYDATALVARHRRPDAILIDQGTSDRFVDVELRPSLFAEACRRAGQALRLHLRQGYDHGYYFIQTHVGEHIAFHAAALNSP